MDWINLVNNNKKYIGKFTKSENKNNNKPCCQTIVQFERIFKQLCDSIMYESENIDKCKIFRYLGWFCCINSNFIHSQSIAEDILDLLIELVESYQITSARDWIKITTGLELIDNNSSQNNDNNLINWDKTDMDDDLTIFNYMWSESNFNTTEYDHYICDTVGIVLTDTKSNNLLTKSRALQFLNSLIVNNSDDVKITSIGNNACFILFVKYPCLLYCSMYSQLTNSNVIDNINIKMLNRIGPKIYKYFSQFGNIDFKYKLSKIEYQIKNHSIEDRIKYCAKDGVDRQLMIKNIETCRDFRKFATDINIDNLCQFLKEMNGVVSGGFMIKSILDDPNFGTDVDIYIPITQKEFENLNPTFYKPFLPSLDMMAYQFCYEECQNIISVWNNRGYFPIQFIFIDIAEINGESRIDQIVNYIQSSFDLSICTGCLSYQQYYPPMGNIDSLINKTSILRVQKMDNDRFNQIGFIKLKSRFKSYKHRGIQIELQDKCNICQNNQPVDLKLGCNHYFHRNCLLRKIRYKGRDKYDVNKHVCPICKQDSFQNQIKITIPKIDHLTDIQLSTYQYCDQCHQLSDPSNFVDNMCEYCQQNYEIHQQLNIFNCPNCGQEIEHISGCGKMVCCIYGGECCGYKCKHGSTQSVLFCGHSWTLYRNNTQPFTN